MQGYGQTFLLVVLICSSYAAYVHLVCRPERGRLLHRVATLCGVIAFLGLSATVAILATALITRDFTLDYVARYSSRLLPWHYSLSALWVGQAGSLLLWAWISSALILLFRFVSPQRGRLNDTAFGVQLACLCFLTAIMIFAADPLKPSLAAPREGLGLSPLLQHPSMLIHPPVIFCAYAMWTIPFSLAVAALLEGQFEGTWTQLARPWALFAWTILLAGLLLGAHWAYQELGWGGYWGWDPVENGSLLPWLTGTAFLHCLMAWRYRNCLKKTALGLAILTFGLCNFATFLTRSGIFSSVHAFSESPIGWMFLGLMVVLLLGGTTLLFRHRLALQPEKATTTLWARETMVLGATLLLLVLTLIVLIGTLVGPVSNWLTGHTVLIAAPFYNNVLIPTGLLLLGSTALVPLLRWGQPPTSVQRRCLWGSAGVGVMGVLGAWLLGAQHWISLLVAGCAGVATATLLASLVLDGRRQHPDRLWQGMISALRTGRRHYAGYLAHMGFVALVIGITGSALGTRRQEVTMKEGESLSWAGRVIHYVHLDQFEQPDKLVVEAVLEISHPGQTSAVLRPGRHFHLLQNEWTTEVDTHSTWLGDFYTVLNAGLGNGEIALTLVDNPLMRWIWFGGFLMGLGALLALWPTRVQQVRIQSSGTTTSRESIAVLSRHKELQQQVGSR